MLWEIFRSVIRDKAFKIKEMNVVVCRIVFFESVKSVYILYLSLKLSIIVKIKNEMKFKSWNKLILHPFLLKHPVTES